MQEVHLAKRPVDRFFNTIRVQGAVDLKGIGVGHRIAPHRHHGQGSGLWSKPIVFHPAHDTIVVPAGWQDPRRFVEIRRRRAGVSNELGIVIDHHGRGRSPGRCTRRIAAQSCADFLTNRFQRGGRH